MKALNRKYIAMLLRDVASKFESGECGMEDEEMVEVASILMHRKMYQEPICKYYNISRATMERWVANGKLPEPKRDGNGRVFWWLDECERSIEEYNRKHE